MDALGLGPLAPKVIWGIEAARKGLLKPLACQEGRLSDSGGSGSGECSERAPGAPWGQKETCRAGLSLKGRIRCSKSEQKFGKVGGHDLV